MVPLKLKLSNFTSYGENPPELDFSSFQMAAISGLNGAGKSSLLDAISWCIWGTSRAGDSADALIRLGATEMGVDFSFELDGNEYTIKRHRSKKSGGSTALEFWSASHNLTEGTIKATQQKIIDTLHLTFETFSNSSFLRQGHADEFTTKGPTDRKRILADILGLDHYDKLEEKAKEKAKDAQTKLQMLEYRLLEIETELSQKEQREQVYSQIKKEEEETKYKLLEIEKLVKSIEDQKKLIELSVHTLEEEAKRFKTIQVEMSELKTQIEVKKQAQSEYQVILDKKELIEKNYNALKELEEGRKVLEDKRSELIKIKDELVIIQKTINNREDKKKAAINKEEILVKELQTKNDSLLSQIEKLKSDKSICPTCNQPIGEEKNKQIIEGNQNQIEENNLELKKRQETIEKYKAVELPEYKDAAIKEALIKDLESQTKDYNSLTSQIAELLKYQDLYNKLSQAEVAVKAHQDAILDLEKIYLSKQEELKKGENQEKNLNLALSELKEVEQRLNTERLVKEELSQKILELTGKIGEAKQLIDRVTQVENLQKEKLEQKTKLREEKEVYEELALAFGKKGIQAMIIEQAIPEIEEETNRLLDRLTEGRMKIALVTQKETKTKVVGAEGKKEHATVETLDIIISDEMGERAYEMYSGGETFRVNFAIRLAISKLLSHRAGAKLQFLVIDEGFGTQDAPGRARLVEAIDAIKEDFAKIVIITHIEELKEEFPTRIEVSKNGTGSTFEIVGAS